MASIAGLLLTLILWQFPHNANVFSESIEKVVKTTIEESIDEKILQFNNSLKQEGSIFPGRSIEDVKIKDGGKISAFVHWKDGPIIDIGNYATPKDNRILLTSKYPSQVFLHLYDNFGNQYILEGNIPNLGGGVKLDGLWSSKDKIIAILANDKIISKVILPEMNIFQDITKQSHIMVGQSFDGGQGNGSIKNVMLYALKEKVK